MLHSVTEGKYTLSKEALKLKFMYWSCGLNALDIYLFRVELARNEVGLEFYPIHRKCNIFEKTRL